MKMKLFQSGVLKNILKPYDNLTFIKSNFECFPVAITHFQTQYIILLEELQIV